MPDRERVIKELMKLHGTKETMDIIFDAITLLKEQEPVEPYVDGEGNYCCKACDTVVGWEELTDAGLTPYVYKFCPECGKAVLWEGR